MERDARRRRAKQATAPYNGLTWPSEDPSTNKPRMFNNCMEEC
jgi:hypothetical protein